MRIAMLSWESLHSIAVGGVASHVTGLATALADLGHDVHVFTRLGHGQTTHAAIDGVHYHRCPYHSHEDFVEDVDNMCRALVDAVFAVEDVVGHFDVVHAHDWLTANAMIWIKQGRGHHCLMTIHATEYARCGNTFHDGQSQRVRDREWAGLYWADHVVAVSHATAREIGWMYETPHSKITTIHNGVHPGPYDVPVDVAEVRGRHNLTAHDPMVLFCGRLVWQKAPDVLIEAIPAVLEHHPDARFVFAGAGAMHADLVRRARELGVDHAVRFPGFVGGTALVELYHAADMVCVPSRNEPFGIVVLEAWSAGKPVIATHYGGPSEFVEHEMDGLKIYPHGESVAWGLLTMLADPEGARTMGRRGRRKVEQWHTWNRIAEYTADCYQRTLRDAAAAAAAEAVAAAARAAERKRWAQIAAEPPVPAGQRRLTDAPPRQAPAPMRRSKASSNGTVHAA